ncbi:YoaK family protein [Streptomyces sp. H27-D2]|uniref:YoaK family protein n=1 Tax=Streptomyces sp. H27-D2 TaxID=3046304 RepID=UPI002DBC7ABD|nr:YoaK family protein [Streptomyces sp. H27-D2]MEC4018659.1 YoaK family protein [Streptomyces sp. H27-D2]
MIAPLRDVWTTLVPAPHDRHGPLPPLLIALTVVTGLVDAFSYLLLGHVFVANMTGNVVFMAFSLAGAASFSLWASVVSLLAFATGALLGGRIANRFPAHRGRMLLGTALTETFFVVAACVCGAVASEPFTGAGRYLLIALLGLGMGAQNAAARRLAVPDLTTTVLTMTITGVAADGRLAGGSDGKVGRRLLSAASMFLGALIGAITALHASATLPLLFASLILTGTVVAVAFHARSTQPWTRPS